MSIGIHSRAYHTDDTVAALPNPRKFPAFQAALDRQRPPQEPPVNANTPRGRALATLGFSSHDA